MMHSNSAICLCDKCQSRSEFVVDLKKFEQAALRLSQYWNEELAHSADSLAFYPFQQSFHEVVAKIVDWRDAIETVNDRIDRDLGIEP